MIKDSELILNPDGTVFHLHVTGDHIADTVIMVGDPARSDKVASYFDTIEYTSRNREFVTHTGLYVGKRMTVVSTGIGCDNIDIVMTEIDAAVNIDLSTRTIKPQKRSLRIVRLGTCGALQPQINIGDYLLSEYSMGIDGLAHFYKNSEAVRALDMEQAFAKHAQWGDKMAAPYVVSNDAELARLFRDFTISGITISAGGFYAPQGRVVRLPIWQQDYLKNIESFRWNSLKINNFEMEGAAIALLGAMLGHRTLTVCAAIAQRTEGEGNADYGKIVDNLLQKALLCLSK